MYDRHTLNQLIETHKNCIDEKNVQLICPLTDEAIEACSCSSQMAELFLNYMFTAGVQNQ